MKNKTFIIKTINSKNAKEQSVVFQGDLGIKNAEAIKTGIQALTFNAASINIQLKNVEKLDVTTIQNIIALKESLTKSGKKVDVISELSQDIERLLTNTGFDKSL